MSTQQNNTFWTRKRILLAAIAGLLVLVAIGAVLVWVIMSSSAREEPQAQLSDIQKAERDTKQAEQDGKLREEASNNIKDKNKADAEKVYQEAISSAATAERKTLLYIDLSEVYYRAGLIKEAFAVMEKANEANPDKYLIADWLSRLYEDQKNYTKAAEYYTLAGKWASSPQNKTAIDRAYYDSQASEMTKLAKGAK